MCGDTEINSSNLRAAFEQVKQTEWERSNNKHGHTIQGNALYNNRGNSK